MTIAVLGGTGAEGLGISARLAVAGEEVIVGSREARRADEAAATLAAELPGVQVRGAPNCDAATAAGMVILAVPFAGVDELLDTCASALGDKVVLEVVNPLRLERGVFRAVQVAEGSVGARVRARSPGARVVSGLKHESAASLRDVGRRLTGDVLLCGDDDAAKGVVADLIRRMPDLRPIDAGGLAVAPLLDQVTALLLTLNRRHRVETSLRIVGL
jgi:8-hydroxy-5-deazaflavin:NADPH oxidoreductase